MLNHSFRLTLLLGAAAAMAAGPARAGDLNPPVGPVAPTHKTLTEIEPRIAVNATNTPGDATSVFKITQPGSYYLTGNVTGEAGKSGIEIASDNVTLDLMGFTLQGVPGSLDGIRAADGRALLSVFNGTVDGFGEDGVDLNEGLSGIQGRVEGIHAWNNGGHGLRVPNVFTVRDCATGLNGGDGFSIGGGSTIDSCVTWGNGGDGFDLPNGSSIVSRCSVISGSGAGFRIAVDSTITACVAISVGGGGFTAGSGNTLRDCVATNNSIHGISAGDGTAVLGCTVELTTAIGITAATGCLIEGCVSRRNLFDGIRVTSACTVRGNVCDANGAPSTGAGIRVEGGDNRIEGNNCTNADRGLDVNAAGNIIVRNTCSGNTLANWDIVAGNVCLVVQAATAGAISGDSGGVSPGSTDPNANFTY